MRTRLFNKVGLWLCLALLALTALPVSAWSGSFDRGVLWEISKAGQQRSYLLGTIHSDHASVTNLPAPVKKALDGSKSFTAELDLNMSSMLQAQMQMLLPETQSLQSIIGAQQYRKCVALMASYGVPEVLVDRMKPWAIAAQLNMPKPTTGVFLDLKLYKMAQQKGLKTYGLETVEEQMSVFGDMTEQQQKTMLEQAIKDFPGMPGKISTLIRYYVNRDLRGMQTFSEAEMKRSDPALMEIIDTKLIKERNHRMVERMQPQLADGKALVAVGALHLPGEQGILQLLENRGYKVKALY